MIERITFKKPHAYDLEDGFSYADMHFHTRYSDTYTRVPSVLRRARKKGVGVAITDHNQIGGSREAWKSRKDVMVVPGIEVSACNGPHMLLYFYSMRDLEHYFEKKLKPYLGQNPFMATKKTMEGILTDAEGYDCLRIAAHPMAISHMNLLDMMRLGLVDRGVLRHINGMEVLSGQLMRNRNLMALAWAAEHGYCFTGGSDGHVLRALGSTLTYARADGLDDFLDSIRKRKNYIIGREMRLLPRLNTYTRQAAKHMRYLKGSIMTQAKLTVDGIKARRHHERR